MTPSSGNPPNDFVASTMGEIVKIKVRPGGSIQFPAICAYCSEPAANSMTLTRRRGRRTRTIDVPLCEKCYNEVRRESGDEERLHRLGRVISVAILVVIAIPVTILLNGLLPDLVSLGIALLTGALVGYGVTLYFRRLRADAARPEKKAIIASASIVEFSWRATTFEFENKAFSDKFVEINQETLMAPNNQGST